MPPSGCKGRADGERQSSAASLDGLPVLQFEMECRPFYVSGFNAHDLVPKSLATPADHNTVGQFRNAPLLWFACIKQP